MKSTRYPRVLLAIAFALPFAPLAFAVEPSAKAPCTTIIVVRHAEQTDPQAVDPPLSEVGAARAKALAAALANSGVQAVYFTQYKRTQETAVPLAERLHLSLTEVPVDKPKLAEYGSELAKRILAEHPGGIVLVVGHSNTVPNIVEALTNVKIRAIDQTEFDRFIVVTAGEQGCTHVLEAQYGHGQ